MKSRSSGASGINISAIGLGCMPLTKFYEKPDEAVTGERAPESFMDYVNL